MLNQTWAWRGTDADISDTTHLFSLVDAYLPVLVSGVEIIFNTTESHWYTSEAFLLCIATLVVIAPFCLVDHIDRLHYARSVLCVL